MSCLSLPKPARAVNERGARCAGARRGRLARPSRLPRLVRRGLRRSWRRDTTRRRRLFADVPGHGCFVVLRVRVGLLDAIHIATQQTADHAGEHFGVPDVEVSSAAVVVVLASAREVGEQNATRARRRCGSTRLLGRCRRRGRRCRRRTPRIFSLPRARARSHGAAHREGDRTERSSEDGTARQHSSTAAHGRSVVPAVMRGASSVASLVKAM
jgi:hypothetical protein